MGGCLVCAHPGAQQIRNRNGSDDRKRNECQAQITEHQSGGGQALALHTSGAFLDLREREVSEDDGGNRSRQHEEENAADQAGNGLAAGGWRSSWRVGGSLIAGSGSKSRNRATAYGTKTVGRGEGVAALRTIGHASLLRSVSARTQGAGYFLTAEAAENSQRTQRCSADHLSRDGPKLVGIGEAVNGK